MVELVAVGALALGCAGWVLLQRWIERHDPGNPGVARECDGGCGGGSCASGCARPTAAPTGARRG